MSEEERIEFKKELSDYSKEELLEKYIDELEENLILTKQWYKTTQKINEVREYIENKVISNGEVIDQLRKIEVKELLEILNKGDD